MKVYILWHGADMDDSGYVRGVYATREAAEADVTADEWFYPDSGAWRSRHYDWCCSVDEEEVRRGPTPRKFGPFHDERIDPNAQRLVPQWVEDEMVRTLTRPTPLWDRLTGGTK